MRLLLKEDELKYKEIISYIQNNWDKREPDLEKETQNFYAEFSKNDLEQELITNKLQGGTLTDFEYILKKANSKAEFVVMDVNISEDVTRGVLSAKGVAFHSGVEFMNEWNNKLSFDKLKSLASNYLNSLGFSDYRNFYEENGNVYYGEREQNKYDARLLGDIVSGKFVMTSNDYDVILTNFKNQLK